MQPVNQSVLVSKAMERSRDTIAVIPLVEKLVVTASAIRHN